MSVSYKGNQVVKPSQQFNDVKIYLFLLCIVKCLQPNQFIFSDCVFAKLNTANHKKLQHIILQTLIFMNKNNISTVPPFIHLLHSHFPFFINHSLHTKFELKLKNNLVFAHSPTHPKP